jgi:predicted O-methyltransferase YrrM
VPRTYLSESAYAGSPRVFIATAAYSFHPNYTHSLARAMPALMQAGIAADLCHVADHCHVDDARNAMVREFLMSKADALVFIDNDVGFEPESLVRLCRYDRDMVAGVYPCKQMETEYPVRVADGIDLQADADGLVEVIGLPTGFLKIKRGVLERMSALEPRKFNGKGQTGIPNAVLFERTFVDGVRYSGDYAFCEKWKAMGGKMYVDPEMRFTHSGNYEWAGTLADHWREKYGVTEARFGWAIERMKSGRFDLETAKWLLEGWGNDWSAAASLLIAAWYGAKKHSRILETGSGISTLVMALANPAAEVHAIESEPMWAEKLREALTQHQIGNVRLHCVSLEDRFYRMADVPEGPYGLVLLDGPSRKRGDRNKSYERLGGRLAGAVILADDANDPQIADGLKEWSQANDRAFSVLGTDRKFAISTENRKEYA